MSAHEVGALAMITAANRPTPFAAFFDGEVWRELKCHSFCLIAPITIRPLVVLDLEDYEAVREVVQRSNYLNPGESVTPLTEAIQRGLRALVKPPRIPEPGLWGVVEDASHDIWVCVKPHRWTRIIDGVEWPWVDLIDPVELRPGIEDAS